MESDTAVLECSIVEDIPWAYVFAFGVPLCLLLVLTINLYKRK